MQALYWICGIILCLFLIGMIRFSAVFEMQDDVRLYLKVLFLKIQIVPKKKEKLKSGNSSYQKQYRWRMKQIKKAEARRAKAAKKAAKKEKEQAEAEKNPEPEPEGTTFSRFMQNFDFYLSLVRTFLKYFNRFFHIDVARFHIRIATGDAANTAIAYGAVTQSVSYLFEGLNRLTNVRVNQEEGIRIETDYAGDTTEAELKLSFSLRVWHVIAILLPVSFKFLKHKFRKYNEEAEAQERAKKAAPDHQ